MEIILITLLFIFVFLLYLKKRKYNKIKTKIKNILDIQIEEVLKDKETSSVIITKSSITFLYGYIYKMFYIYNKNREGLNTLEEKFVKDLFISLFCNKDYKEKEIIKLIKSLDVFLKEEEILALSYFDCGNTYADLFLLENCTNNTWFSYLKNEVIKTHIYPY